MRNSKLKKIRDKAIAVVIFPGYAVAMTIALRKEGKAK